MEDGWSLIGPYALVIGLALFWALAEVLRTFEKDPVRALKNGWTWAFIGFNMLFSALVYLVVRLLPIASLQSMDPLLLALVVGVGWQTLLRTNINLIQPLNPEVSKAIAISVAEQYGRLQGFFMTRIGQSLLDERQHWLFRAIALPVQDLEQSLRVTNSVALVDRRKDIEAYIEKTKQLPEDQRKVRLAQLLLDIAGLKNFKTFVKNMEAQHAR